MRVYIVNIYYVYMSKLQAVNRCVKPPASQMSQKPRRAPPPVEPCALAYGSSQVVRLTKRDLNAQ